ncbi:hypothetical protein AB0C13_39855 [Streptomyces sp. NPDC049099]|uniref:hypothetical protein n=1 Tax=Streptomyces sp. NPDC049099 TaxID=3155768 RepID=UPI003424D86D
MIPTSWIWARTLRVFEVGEGSGIADDGGDLGGEGGGALVEPGEQLLGEGDLVSDTVAGTEAALNT